MYTLASQIRNNQTSSSVSSPSGTVRSTPRYDAKTSKSLESMLMKYERVGSMGLTISMMPSNEIPSIMKTVSA